MPFVLITIKNGYQVKNKKTGTIHAKNTTKEKAKKQIKLLNYRTHI
jgi:hypothetical protein